MTDEFNLAAYARRLLRKAEIMLLDAKAAPATRPGLVPDLEEIRALAIAIGRCVPSAPEAGK